MVDEVRQLRVEVQVLERAVQRFEERLAGLREEVTRGFDRVDILLATHFGDVLKLQTHMLERIEGLERKVEDNHAAVLAAIESLRR